MRSKKLKNFKKVHMREVLSLCNESSLLAAPCIFWWNDWGNVCAPRTARLLRHLAQQEFAQISGACWGIRAALAAGVGRLVFAARDLGMLRNADHIKESGN